jgi:hypothetical protein
VSYLAQDLNLLELRKSQRDQIAKALADGSTYELENLKRNIDNTLSRFTAVVPENEEQVYLFGVDIHQLLKQAGIKPVALGEIRGHLNPSVRVVFVCGLLGLSLQDTRVRLSADRKKRVADQEAELAARIQRQHMSEESLVQDIKVMVSETASSLLPPDVIPRK